MEEKQATLQKYKELENNTMKNYMPTIHSEEIDKFPETYSLTKQNRKKQKI